MAPPDAQAEASYGCSAVFSYCLRWLQVPIDWGQSIYHFDAEASYSVEPLSPMAPSDAQAEASYGCSAVFSYCLRWLQVPIDWGQSIYHFDAEASYSVEPLSPMAPPDDAQAEAFYGCSAVFSYCLRWLQVPIDWGQSIYHSYPTHEKSVPGT